MYGLALQKPRILFPFVAVLISLSLMYGVYRDAISLSGVTYLIDGFSLRYKIIYNAEEEMRIRAVYVREKCANISLRKGPTPSDCNPMKTKSKTLVDSHQNAFLYTPIPKCGWTTWLFFLFSSRGQIQELLSDSRRAWSSKYEKIGLQKVGIPGCNNLTTYNERLVFVRHPYDRLVSSYKDKVLSRNSAYVKLWHTPCSWVNENTKETLTFKQFVNCIITRVKKSGFDDMSSYEASHELDHHWSPQYHLSLPCSVNYTLIGHHASFKEDSKAALKLFNINATIVHENESKPARNQTLSYWYCQLEPDMLKQLQIIYKYDFEVFDFDPTPPSCPEQKSVGSV